MPADDKAHSAIVCSLSYIPDKLYYAKSYKVALTAAARAIDVLAWENRTEWSLINTTASFNSCTTGKYADMRSVNLPLVLRN